MLASILQEAGAEELTAFRTKPSRSRQLPSRSEASQRNSHAAEPSRAHVSDHLPQSGPEETYVLPNQAIALTLATIQRRVVPKKLTFCRMKSLG